MTQANGGFDWPAMMRVGMQQLALKPDEFWALTPAEFWLLVGEDMSRAPMGRSRLDELSAAYPDGATRGADDG